MESFSIMDYSLLLGIHNLDKEPKAKHFTKLEAYFEMEANGQRNLQINEDSL